MLIPFRRMTGALAFALLASLCGAAEVGYLDPQSCPTCPLSKQVDQAKTDYQRALQAVNQRKTELDQASGEYDRNRAGRRLAAAEDDLAKARKSLRELGIYVPAYGDGGPTGATADQGADYSIKVPEVGASSPLDPNVFEHSWVGEPGVPSGKKKGRRLSRKMLQTADPAEGSAPAGVEYGRTPGKPDDALPRAASGGGIPVIPRMPRGATEPVPAQGGPVAQAPRVEAAAPAPSAARRMDIVRDSLPLEFKPAGGGEKDRMRLELVRSARRALEAGDDAGVLRWARMLRDLAPEDQAAGHLLALILNRLGRYEEAAREAELALRSGPATPQLYETLAWAQLHMGLYEEAAASASAAVAMEPGAALSYAIRACAYERLRRPELKAVDIRKAAALKPASFAAMARAAQAGGAIFNPAPAAAPAGPTPAQPKRRQWAWLMLAAPAAVGLYFLRKRRPT